uniref:Uncharacterized protein n=1 Tax=Triticum urartu TaxID=4572 RepID=A0A8R7R831_TRIUA
MAGIKAALEISEVGEPVVLVVVVEVVAVAVEVLVGEAVAAAPVLERRLRLLHVAHNRLVRRVDPLEVDAVFLARDVRVVLQREAVEGLLNLSPGCPRRQPQRAVVVLLQHPVRGRRRPPIPRRPAPHRRRRRHPTQPPRRRRRRGRRAAQAHHHSSSGDSHGCAVLCAHARQETESTARSIDGDEPRRSSGRLGDFGSGCVVPSVDRVVELEWF